MSAPESFASHKSARACVSKTMGVGRRPSEMRAHVALLALVVVWAGSFSVIKALLDHGVAALDVAILRYAIAAPGFALILWRTRGLPGLTNRDAVRVVAAGLIIVVGYHVSLNLGTQHTTPAVAALVVALSPGLTLGLAVSIGLERFQVRRLVGLVVALVGVAVVVTLGSGEEVSLDGVKGPLIVLGAPLSFAVYNVLVKPLLARHDLLALTASTSLVGMIGLAPFVRSSTLDAVGGLSADDALLVLYLGLAATFLGYIGWNVGLRGLGPTRAVTYTYAISPLAVLIAYFSLDERITLWLALGAALVVGGVAVTQRATPGGPRLLRASALRSAGR
jgi:drug/metabolite transporter (DMT)-like permease